jgi:Flp pilus assembly protein TadG
MRQRTWQEAGQDLVEYAMVLPLFLFLTFGVIEFSLLYFQYSTVANAAREGARAGIVMPNELCDQACLDAHVVAVARTLTTELNPLKLHVAVEHPAEDLITVVVTYDSGFITRIAAEAAGQEDFAITLRSASTMRRER